MQCNVKSVEFARFARRQAHEVINDVHSNRKKRDDDDDESIKINGELWAKPHHLS